MADGPKIEVPLRGELVDPDPFTVGLGLIALAFAGGSYLEARRQRQYIERQAQERFRTVWFSARRTLIHYRRVVEEFATYVAEDNFGATQFGFGRVRLTIDQGRAEALQRLHANVHTTATHLADDLAALSEFLGEEDRPAVEALLAQLESMATFPVSYSEVVTLARRAFEEYDRLVSQVGERNSFG